MSPWLFLPLAYLLGSIPFGYLIGKAYGGVDIRTVGSGNVGATNVMRSVGRFPGLCVLILDAAKGAGPVAISFRMELPWVVVAGVALAAVLGHVFSVFLRFRGGKGVATAIGAYLPIVPLPSLVVIAIFALVLFWKHYVSLASVVAVGLFPLVLVLFNQSERFDSIPVAVIVSATAATAVIVARHLGNIHRLLMGEEARLADPVEVRSK